MAESLLIVAAGPLQVPAIKEAAVMGLRTVAVDVNPSAPGMALADASYPVDIFDVSAVERIALAEKISGVMTLCTDAPVRTVAAVASALGLPAISPQAAADATDKRRMRAAMSAHAVPIPAFREIESFEDALRAGELLKYPFALKVPCSSGSRGVYRVDAAEELREYLPQARKYHPHGSLLAEEWMEGEEVSVEGASCGDGVHIVQVTDKLVFRGAFPVEAGHSQPSGLPASTVEEIGRVTEAGVRALGLENCAFHAELKITASGPKIVEIGARLGGDRIATHLTPLSTGVNMVRAAIQIALGETPDLTPTISRGSAIRYFHADACGRAESIEGLDQVARLPGVELLYAESERDGPLVPGFQIPEIRSSLDRYGHVIFSGESAAEACARADQAISMVKFRIPQLQLNCP
jgi:biotin carboxylase